MLQDVCQSVLSVLDIVYPGRTKYRCSTTQYSTVQHSATLQVQGAGAARAGGGDPDPGRPAVQQGGHQQGTLCRGPGQGVRLAGGWLQVGTGCLYNTHGNVSLQVCTGCLYNTAGVWSMTGPTAWRQRCWPTWPR